jgi:D-serine deaminase-like pyridoxal phosphate-dependent protein
LTTAPFAGLETPCLLLDRARLDRNAERMRARCALLGVDLRPHLKTAKSVDVARVASGGAIGSITVSTLAEAAYFAAAGWRDILYATAIAPAKVPRAGVIQRETGARLTLGVDNVEAVRATADAAAESGASFGCLVEIDCGEHRSGVAPASNELLAVAQAIAAAAPHLTLAGVMTHAGHSYGFDDPAAVRALAEIERAAAVTSADRLRAAGHHVLTVSVGSTPTVVFADHLQGVSEVRAGIYLFWDLSQLSRRVCAEDDIAVSVLATVISHQNNGRSVVLDAGALALSKDTGANRYMPDAQYGWVCDPVTGRRLGTLSVSVVHQEHGTVPVPDESWFARLPVGSQVRILPNHACLTCATHSAYEVIEDGKITQRWERTGGW